MFSSNLAHKQSYLASEKSSADFIPYYLHCNEDTILLKDNSLLKIIKINGFAFETADDDDIDIKKNARNNLLKGMASGNFALWFHTIRRREEAYPGGDYTNIFAKRLNREWKDRHSGDRCFVNEHYISILRKDDNAGIAKIGSIFKKLRNKADKTAKNKSFVDAMAELNEITDRILNGFSNYRPELLALQETSEGIYSEILKFLGVIVNCGQIRNYRLSPIPLDHYIQTNRLYFSSKVFEVMSPTAQKFGAIASVKEYRPSTNAGILDGFLQMPFEFIICQSYTYTNRMMAISSMQLQQRRMIQAEDVAVSQIREIDEALDAAMSGKFAFGNHHLTICCFEDSIKSVENAISMSIVEFSNVGITAVRERINMEACFWSQLPGNMKYVVRKSTVNTLNLASFASFHNYPSGKRTGNHWGDACTVLNTVSGTPYFFSFHVRDVGHTMIIGPTGAGKTVMMNFLCAQAQKFNCRMFFFDKDRGAEIFIRALGGKYSVLESSRSSGFNPLKLHENAENKAFLIEWLTVLLTVNGETINAEDMERISEAVNGNFRLPPEKRILRNIAPFLGMGGPGSLSGRLEMWHGEGSHSKLFDNDEDIIDFFSAHTFGFEMAEILKDKKSISPVLLYLFHRIQSSLDGTPTMIILDEAWALIDNPVFAPKIKDWLKVFRKLNAFVVFATQSVEDATKSSISDTLVQQTATQIYLPNLKATEVYKTAFMLSEREFQLIKTTDPSSRYFLVKQDQSGVIAKIDLNGMGDVIRVLSGRAETVILLNEIIKEVGSDKPEDWIEFFYKRSKNI
jgi:type IV secretion system protein VirB4